MVHGAGVAAGGGENRELEREASVDGQGSPIGTFVVPEKEG